MGHNCYLVRNIIPSVGGGVPRQHLADLHHLLPGLLSLLLGRSHHVRDLGYEGHRLGQHREQDLGGLWEDGGVLWGGDHPGLRRERGLQHRGGREGDGLQQLGQLRVRAANISCKN